MSNPYLRPQNLKNKKDDVNFVIPKVQSETKLNCRQYNRNVIARIYPPSRGD